MKKNFLISVIVPIYNVENYIDETLQSIVGQSVGFTDNIQLILVNDGSPDRSDEVCKKYVKCYPDNITYIKQKNSGVSAARNKGAKSATGKYIHFMDSDDVISRHFYKESVSFLQRYASVDFVASKIKYFDGKYTEHYLNSKFKQTRLIDVTDEPQQSIFHISSILLVRDATKKLKFDTQLKVAEDAKYVNEILCNKKKYGVLSSTTFHYRKRSDNSSAISTKMTNRSYFIDTPKHFLEYLIDLWTSGGVIHRYIQHLVMNDIAWKISEEKKQSILTDNEMTTYKSQIYNVASKIDDDILLSNKILSLDQKIFLLRKKYGNKKYEKLLTINDSEYFFNNVEMFRYSMTQADSALVLDFIHDLGGGRYKLEGYALHALISSRDKRFIQTSCGEFEIKPVSRPQRQNTFLGDKFTDNEAFEVIIEVSSVDTITGLLKSLDGTSTRLPIFTKQFTGLGVLNHTYHQKAGVILRKNNHAIKVYPNTRYNRWRSELRFSLQVMRNIQLRKAVNWIKGTVRNIDSLLKFAPPKKIAWEFTGPIALLLRSVWIDIVDVVIRQLYFIGLYKSDRPIWLISDRGTLAGDNGEALFRYIADRGTSEADVYFVIAKTSPDYERLQKIGRVVDVNSLKYKMLFLRASKIISSHADYYVYNAFGYRWTHFNDLYSFDYIFLQHGIIQSDLSGWLNRFEKNIKLFITSTKAEYNSIVSSDYGYDKSIVKLTGLTRYDLLENKPKGMVILAPTWRKNILPEERHGKSGIRAHSDTFKDTEYFEFYNNLMNDPRVLDALRTRGMTGEFYLHPAFSRQVGDFSSNGSFTIKTPPYDYKQAFMQGNLLITDYSSVAFDFAYLRKPIIYTQFDRETLHENHIAEEGYFSYEDDGLGEVTYDYESAVTEIVRTIESGCKLNSKYSRRVEKFFSYRDQDNSKRVYDLLLEL
jgi:glycosyltransferase involved in cell wall biosynthesis/CDP-glycerol glycerophosphotransferase (TagB/SpsB family)